MARGMRKRDGRWMPWPLARRAFLFGLRRIPKIFRHLNCRCVVTSRKQPLRRWRRRLNAGGGSRIIGLTVEYNRPWNRAKSSSSRVATVQLAYRSTCILFQYLKADQASQRALRKFLETRNFFFACVGDVRTKLQKHLLNPGPWNCIDLGKRLKRQNEAEDEAREKPQDITEEKQQREERNKLPRKRYHGLARRILDEKFHRKKSLIHCDWEADDLSKEQAIAACQDAILSYRMALELIRREPAR